MEKYGVLKGTDGERGVLKGQGWRKRSVEGTRIGKEGF